MFSRSQSRPHSSLIRSIALALVLTLGAATACSDDPGDEAKDAAAADVFIDAGNDAVAADTGAKADGSTTDGGVVCAGQPVCVDENGIEDLSKCPAPQNEWACISGCCEKKSVCKSDADCAAKLGTVVCPDKRFTCGCDVATGACFQSVCGDDAQCAGGQICDSGGCHDKPAASTLSAVLLRDNWVARPKDSGDAVILFGAQARDSKGAVDPTAVFEWVLKGDGFTLKDGKLTAGDAAGKATITANLAGGAASNVATLWNLGPLPAGASVRVTFLDEGSFAPLDGKVYAVCGPADATPTTATVTLTGGQAVFSGLKLPCDLHAVSPDHDMVSVMRYDVAAGSDVVIAARLRHFAALAYDVGGKAIVAETTLQHGDIYGGVVDYSGQGEAGLGITSLGVGSDLLLFNLDALIGPTVTRPFHPDAPSLVNPNPGVPQDIPGGVTFFLGKKVIESYVVVGPPGKHIVWSLSGRLPLSDLLSQVSSIVGAVQDGLDVGKVVGVLLPYLQGFYSQVITNVDFADKSGVQAPKSLNLAPDVPLGVSTEVQVGDLPSSGEGQWADLVIAIGGAMMPDGVMIPLGLAAGSDTSGEGEKPDGKVDGDVDTDGNQPLALNTAPLHSGLRVGSDNRIVVTAAINVGGKGKREGGSIVFSPLGPPGAKHKAQAFLPYAYTSVWDAKDRSLSVSKVEGAAFYRAVLTGSEGRRWSVLLPASAVGKPVKLPDPTAWGVDTALANAPKRVFVGAFELRGGSTDLWKALSDGAMVDLVRRTARSSFIDAH